MVWLLLLALAFLLAACDGIWRWRHSDRWISPLYQDHPLVARVWKPSENRFATAGEVYDAIQRADFVLVGEKHDNADHHRHQAVLMREMFSMRRKPAVVFEMLTPDQQAPLDAHLAAHPGDAAGIGKAVGWEDRGWPDWRIYWPVADMALKFDAPLLAGGLDRETIRAVSRKGRRGALGATRARRLRQDEPIGTKMHELMSAEISESHCGQMPRKMFNTLVSITLVKDAVMAEAMINGRGLAERDSALLIAGTGHVRADWGVPWHLRRLSPGARIVSVGLVEVAAGAADPQAYADAYGGSLPFDFVWFAPRVDDRDPCEVYADQLRRMGEKHKGAAESTAE